MSRPDHYATLGVPPTATLAEIVRAYRRAAAHAHPDRGGSHERMQALNEAKAVLTDPARRARYDAGEPEPRPGPPPIDVAARQLIGQLFTDAIHNNVLNPIESTRGGLHNGIATADEKIRMNNLAVRRLQGQFDRVIAKGDQDIYGDLLRGAIEAAQDSNGRLADQRAKALRALEILAADYEPGPGSVPKRQDYEFTATTMQLMMDEADRQLRGAGIFGNPGPKL